MIKADIVSRVFRVRERDGYDSPWLAQQKCWRNVTVVVVSDSGNVQASRVRRAHAALGLSASGEGPIVASLTRPEGAITIVIATEPPASFGPRAGVIRWFEVRSERRRDAEVRETDDQP